MAQEALQVGAWDQKYREYQAALASRYLIPKLRAWGIDPAGKRVLEVGCGDGGCAAEFHRAGAEVTALDIDERLVRIALELNRQEAIEYPIHVGDICDESCSALQAASFDIVLLRDVVEHLERLDQALRVVLGHLAPGGVLFVDFPPYYSPYGAHQQTLPRKKIGFLPYNKLPYIQLLPDALFYRIVGGDSAASREVMRLRRIRLTLRRFRRQVRAAGLRTRNEHLYLLRPSFKLRYGTPVLAAFLLGAIPGLNEFVVTGANFLLERDAARADPR